MVRGYAGGFGYDKRSAAVSSAAKRMPTAIDAQTDSGEECRAYDAFRAAILVDGGSYFYDRLRDAGFTVIQCL